MKTRSKILQGMHKFKVILIIILFQLIILNQSIIAQTDSTELSTTEILDDLLHEPDIESDNEDVYGILEELIINPIDINTAGLSDLEKIPGLSPYFASIILEHRNKYGSFFSVNELSLVEQLPKDVTEKITPFIKVDVKKYEDDQDFSDITSPKSSNVFDNVKINFRGRIINDLQERRGFTEGRYEGSPPKIYNRLLFRYENTIEAGILTEKDAGEKSFNEFTSFHAALKNYDMVNVAVVGDYTIEFGQGLAVWSPFAFPKGADVLYPIKRKGKFISPYKSTNENNFFRGAAATIVYQNFSFSGFYSNNYFDANIDSLSNIITSTPVDGYHRTTSEISKRKSAKELTFGTSIEYSSNSKNVKAGALFFNSKFSSPFLPSGVFDLSGDKFNFYSVYYDLHFHQINLFGETAFDGASAASIIGAIFSFNRNFSFVTSVRSYPRNFKNVHGYAFGEKSGSTKNEFGIYSGFQWRTRLGIINFYYDQFKFPYAGSDNPLPTNGFEFLFDLRSKPFDKIQTDLRFKYEKKDVLQKIENIKPIVPRTKQSIRGEISFEASKKIKLRSRIEINNYRITQSNVNELGKLAFQEVHYYPIENLSLSARIIFFQTESFNSAIYEYENDLLGILSNTALYGSGVRWYMVLRYRLLKYLSLSAKYSETFKPLEKSLSSGFSEIKNNIDNKLSFQLEVNF